MQPASTESEHFEPVQRFLAKVLHHGLESRLRQPEEFLEHFSPSTIMVALADEPERRGRLLAQTTGIRLKVAMRKSPQSSADDLEIALEEGETSALNVLKLFDTDEQVRFLDNARLWAYVTFPRWWDDESLTGDRRTLVHEHTRFVIEAAFQAQLLEPRDVIDTLSITSIVARLPTTKTTALIEHALLRGRSGEPFDDIQLLEVVGLGDLIQHMPLSELWQWIIEAKVAARHGLTIASTTVPSLPGPDSASGHPEAVEPDDSELIEGALFDETELLG